MKKIIILLLFAMLVIFSQKIFFVSYADEEKLQKELQMRLQEVLQKRNEVWNRLLIGEVYSEENFRKDLQKIVTEPLLSTDLSTFQYLSENPTSFEAIRGVAIKNCRIEKINFNHVVLSARLIWQIAGYEESNVEENYIIEMKKTGNKWKLYDYRLKSE